MNLKDATKLVKIELMIWNGNGYTPDFANDFFDAGILPYDAEHDAYIVNDVDYCIEQALDWKYARGDFYGEDETPADDKSVFVDGVRIKEWQG